MLAGIQPTSVGFGLHDGENACAIVKIKEEASIPLFAGNYGLFYDNMVDAITLKDASQLKVSLDQASLTIRIIEAAIQSSALHGQAVFME